MRTPVLALILVAIVTSVAQVSPPRLGISLAPDGQVSIRWRDDGLGSSLEQADFLGDAILWRPVNITPGVEGGEVVVTLEASDQERFFRLHRQELVSIAASSPVDGETGVGVLRETIVQFGAPLSAQTVLGTNNFYATSAGRKVLSRVELSSDRTRATLFYLEPLPGSSRVYVTFDGTEVKDSLGNPIDADGDGIAGGTSVIAFDTLSLTSLGETAVVGRVFASELVPGSDTGTNAVNKPLAGVTITVDGMEQTLRAVTDETGSFTLSPVPAGKFFVHIDGRTVSDPTAGIRYPDKAYYPFVGKVWEATAGRTNNPAGGTGTIFLPLISSDTLQPVSMALETKISFPDSVIAKNPALAGVSITVPANSLFSDDGTRGGKVGIAPVPPDRLPGPLPPGLELPIVITVQTDGPLNFDKPAPVCFPNLPDPVLGAPLPAGSKQALISFNHKKGIWEEVGSMTVTADGKFVCSDPGVGILQPGWHGVAPPPVPLKPKAPIHDKGCKRDQAKFDACLQECFEFNVYCQKLAQIQYAAEYAYCMELKKDLGNDQFWVCLDEYYSRKNLDLNRDACTAAYRTCTFSCSDCFSFGFGPKSGLSSRAIPSADDPTANQIVALFDQMAELTLPFAPSRAELPQDVVDKINGLRQQASSLVGGNGNPIGYLNSILGAAEEEQSEAIRKLGIEPEVLNPGNAPAYPVLYAAFVVRPRGIFIIRGETGPFGEYSLFVPRDGVLQSVSFYDPRAKTFGFITPSQNANSALQLPRFNLFELSSNLPDSDHDGLADVVEQVYGTDPSKADSDGDGIPDGAEVGQGANPLDGFVARNGVVAATQTPGAAVDVWAGGDFIATAEGTAGISVFRDQAGRNPIMIAHVQTLGSAGRVSGSGNFIAAAEGDAGISIIEVEPVTRIRQQIAVPGAQVVLADADTVYVGQASGEISAVDLQTGAILNLPNQALVDAPVVDLALASDYLYVLTSNLLRVISLVDGEFRLLRGSAGLIGSRRLFAGGGIVYAVNDRGYRIFDLGNPSKPTLASDANMSLFGWRQFLLNGSGLGVAVQGSNSGDDITNDIWLYDASNPKSAGIFLTILPTPGIARAAALFNGMAYVADDAAGLQVVNYQAYDSKGIPPTIKLDVSFPIEGAVQLSPVRVTANAADDVQVRNVEFYIDGEKVFTDGSFPFEYRFLAPVLTVDKTNFVLRARAFDTGGNSTSSGEMVVPLLPDRKPPGILKTAPLGGAKILKDIFAYFNESLDPATVTGDTFQLFSAGPDGLLGTPDDKLVDGGAASYSAPNKQASLSFSTALPNGLYRVIVNGLADTNGNKLANYGWQLRVADAVFWNRDSDGLWDNPANWSTGVVPRSNEDVVIDVPASDLIITHFGGVTSIKTLFANEALEIIGGSLEVTGDHQINANVTLNGGTLKGMSIKESDQVKLIVTSHRDNALDGVTLDGDLDLAASFAHLSIRNNLALNGTIFLANSGVLGFFGDQTFATGTIVFGDNGGFLSIEGNGSVTFGSAVVVRGKAGFIGTGFLLGSNGKLINKGLISADTAGPGWFVRPAQLDNLGRIEVKDGISLTMDGAAWNNAGVIDVSLNGTFSTAGAWNNEGTIKVIGATVNLGGAFTLANLGTFNRIGGTVNLTGLLDLDGGTLTLNAATGPWVLRAGTIKSGTIAESGANLMFSAHPDNTLDGVAVNGNLELSDNGRCRIRNGLQASGGVSIGTGAVISFAGDQDFQAGTILFTRSSFMDIENNTTLTLGAATVVHGNTGNIRLGDATSKIVNQGLISADVAGTTIFIGGGGQLVNTGAIEARNGGSFSLSPATWTNAGIIDGNGGTLTLGGVWSNSGTITANNATVNLDGTFTLAALGKFNRNGGKVNLIGLLDLNGETLTLDDSTGPWIMNGGTMKGGKLIQNKNLVFTGILKNTFDAMAVTGGLDLTTPGARLLIRNGLALSGTVILDNSSALGFQGDQTFDNATVLFAGNSGFLGIERASTLTLGPNIVVHGKSGAIGQGVILGGSPTKLINQGLISADVENGSILVNPKEFENDGTIAADVNASLVTITSSTFKNTGTIREQNGGKVVVNQ